MNHNSDKEHLDWILHRLVKVHGENPNFDYMLKLRSIIYAMPIEQNTPNTGGYPESCGSKTGGTSVAAARSMDSKAKTLRKKILELLTKVSDITPDEAARKISETPFSIRPRFTELCKLGKIQRANKTRPNESGRQADAWTLVSPVSASNLSA